MKILNLISIVCALTISANGHSATVIALGGDVEHLLFGIHTTYFPGTSTVIDDSNSRTANELYDIQYFLPGEIDPIPSQGLSLRTYLDETGFNGGTFDIGFDFIAPYYERLEVGTYNIVDRAPFDSLSSQAGMRFSFRNNGCDRISGNFTILELNSSIELNQYGYPRDVINNLAIDFTHTCFDQKIVAKGYFDENGDYVEPVYADAYMFGSIRINSDIPLNIVPIPAAIWLFGSGLMGLIGFAMRKKHNQL